MKSIKKIYKNTRQSGQGIITLYDKDGDIVKIRQYKGIVERANIINLWSKTYGQRYKTMYYQINPSLQSKRFAKYLELNHHV